MSGIGFQQVCANSVLKFVEVDNAFTSAYPYNADFYTYLHPHVNYNSKFGINILWTLRMQTLLCQLPHMHYNL